MDYNSMCFCPECQGTLITIIEKGEVVCSQCGLILNEKLLFNGPSEPNLSTNYSKKEMRGGLSVSPQFSTINTCVIHRSRTNDPNLKRAIKLNSYLPWDKKKLLIALTELKRVTHKLSLPKYFVKEAFNLYKEALKENLIRGRSIKGIIIVLLYYLCKLHNVPRTSNEFLNESFLNEKRFNRYYISVVKFLNLKRPIQNPVANISRFISDLGLGFATEKLTCKILEEYLKHNSIAGVNPNGLCAGAIYLASKYNGQRIGQKRIGDLIGVSDSTLRARYYEIINGINLNILNEK